MKKLRTSQLRESSIRTLLENKKRYSQYYRRNPDNKKFQSMLDIIERDIQSRLDWFTKQLANKQLFIYCTKQQRYIEVSHPVVNTQFKNNKRILVTVLVLNYGIPVEQVQVPFNELWIKVQE